MTTRRSRQLALAAVLTGMAVWWFTTRTDDKRMVPIGVAEPSSADYAGPDAVIHAVGAVKTLAGAEVGRFDSWYDKPGKRFSAHTPDGLWMLYQDGVLRAGAPRGRHQPAVGAGHRLRRGRERYLRYLQWVGDPSLLANLSVVAEETIAGERATKRLMPGMGHVWVGADGRLLRFEPLNKVDEGVGLSYDQLTGVRPAEVPATVFAAARSRRWGRVRRTTAAPRITPQSTGDGSDVRDGGL